MKKSLALLVFAAVLSGPQSFATKIVGNGRGGEIKNGVRSTVFSAGLYHI
jgi:hypothetical protein